MSTLLKSAAKLLLFFYICKNFFTYFSFSTNLSVSYIKIAQPHSKAAIMAYYLSYFRILNIKIKKLKISLLCF